MKLAIYGVTGSGKTMGALKIATGMGKKIALIDTENGSASLYATQFDFDEVTMSPPFTTTKYIMAINEAVKLGYDVLIIDSLSHAWNAEGGLLEQKESLDLQNPRSNSFTNWRPVTKMHNAFLSTIIHADIHIIATMRAKQEYAMVENDKGKMAPQKVGMGAIQREGIEYEFTTVIEVDAANNAHATKDRTGLFQNKTFKISESVGEALNKWLNEGEKKLPPQPETPLKNYAADLKA